MPKSCHKANVSYSIGIAGAGIMGRLLAWRLAEQGFQITIFDRDSIETGQAAAYTAAGMLTPFSEMENAELAINEMGMQSLSLWPEYAKRLCSDLGFQKKGTLVVAHQEDEVELQRFKQQLDSNLVVTLASSSGAYAPQPFSNVPNHSAPDIEGSYSKESHLQALSMNGLLQKEPELTARFSEAIFIKNEAWICPKCVMQVLADNLLERRVRWYSNTEVTDIGPYVIKARKQSFEFDLVIDTRGLGAKKSMQDLRGVRGELLWVRAPEVKLSHMIRLIHPRYRLYVVPRKDDLYVIGATQIESDDLGEITVRSALELLSALYSIHSGFAEAKIVEMKTNCRPALPDNLPRINQKEGLIEVNGLFRHGYLLSPVLAEQVVDVIENKVSILSNL
jgi:glycine oxidase